MIVFLTGSTGFIGGELLISLSKLKEISKIYCLIRVSNGKDALARLQHVFDLHGDFFDRKKIIPVAGDLFDEHLTESLIGNKDLQDVDLVIHSAANTSFSRIYDDMVQRANIGGLEKILLWAKKLQHLDTFLYIGTATICGKDIKDREVYENESPNLAASHLVKYTYTKMQGEILIHQHLPEEKILIARPSIVMGDSRPIIPRSPVILWALATFNVLRLIPMRPNTGLDIVPVDYVAKAICSLLLAKRKHQVYHISSGSKSATTPSKLTETLAPHFNHRPEFLYVPKHLLAQMKLWAKQNLKPGSELYDYSRFLKYWEIAFKEAANLRIILAGLVPYIEFIELGQVFDNSRILEDTPIGLPTPAHIYINNSMDYFGTIDIFEGAQDP